MSKPSPDERSLATIRLLSGMSPRKLRNVERACKWRAHDSGAKIIDSGDNNREVYFLVRGAVHVLDYATSQRAVSFATLGPGDIFGELAAIDGKPRSATVVAATSCTLGVMSGRAFRELIANNPDIALSLLERMADVIRRSNDRIFNLSSLKASQRVCLELLRMAALDAAGSGAWVIYPAPTQKSLAEGAGTTRETVARMFHDLFAEGVIEKKAKTLYIRNRDELEHRSMVAELGA